MSHAAQSTNDRRGSEAAICTRSFYVTWSLADLDENSYACSKDRLLNWQTKEPVIAQAGPETT